MKLAAIDFDAVQSLGLPGFKYGSATLGTIVGDLLPYLFSLAGILLLLYLIYGGFQYILSQGDPKAIQSSRNTITTALLGFAIVFIAFWVTQIIARILNIPSIISIF